MIEASKAAELSDQPAKRGRRAWLIAVAVVVAVVTIVLLANSPKPEPVKVWFVRATNYLGYEKLVLELKNALPREISFYALTQVGDRNQPRTPGPRIPYYDRAFGTASARTNFYFTLDVPRNEASYYIEWGFHDPGAPAPRWSRLRRACNKIFHALGMPDLAGYSLVRDEKHYIPSTSIKE